MDDLSVELYSRNPSGADRAINHIGACVLLRPDLFELFRSTTVKPNVSTSSSIPSTLFLLIGLNLLIPYPHQIWLTAYRGAAGTNAVFPSPAEYSWLLNAIVEMTVSEPLCLFHQLDNAL